MGFFDFNNTCDFRPTISALTILTFATCLQKLNRYLKIKSNVIFFKQTADMKTLKKS